MTPKLYNNMNSACRNARRGTRRSSKMTASWIMIMAIAMVGPIIQTAAFSPSSLKPNGLLHTTTTNSWRGKSSGNNNRKSAPQKSHLTGRTTANAVSNFALLMSAASSAAASTTRINIASSMSPISASNLAVSLDRPLLSPVEYTYRSPASSKGVWSSFLAVLLSDVFKTALVAFVLAVGVSFLPKLFSRATTTSATNSNDGGSAGIHNFLASKILTPIQNMLPNKTKKKQTQKKESYSTPMPFEGDGGWGKSTLRSKTSIGSFTIYEFALPESYYTVPLALGQQLEFCCLSSDDVICTGCFYPYEGGGASGESKSKKKVSSAGGVRVVLPNDKEEDEGSSKFNEVLRSELRVGDEVAIKPGKSHLTYNGKHVPVTDMVYLASGLGIVPILDQIKAITPRGSSSVKVASVTWFNDRRGDFDLAMDDLEAEYMKFPTKLAVSCIMDDVMKNGLEGNKEVEEAVPYFNAGTMAVVCGPKRFAEKAQGYLMRRGYPENCICVLP